MTHDFLFQEYAVKIKLDQALLESKEIIALALPLIIALAAQKGLQLVAILMLGLLGADALAAGALASSIYMIFIVVSVGILSAVGILIAQEHGRNSSEGITRNLYNGYWVSLLLCLPVIFVVWKLPTFLLLLGQEAYLVTLAKEYLHAAIWGYPALVGFFTLREFVSALSQSRLIFYVCVVAIPVNGLLSYILMYGKLGLPPLAIAGVGYANAITEWGMLFALLLLISRSKLLRKYLVLPKSWLKLSTIAHIFRMGLPSGATFFFDVGMCSIITLMMGYFGAISLASHQIAMQSVSFAYTFPLGMGFALGLRISRLLGADDFPAAMRSAFIGISLGIIFAILMGFLFFFTPTFFVNLFIHPNESDYFIIKKTAATYLGIAGIFLCFDGLQGILNGCLRGFEDTFIPMAIALLCYFLVALGGGYLLAFKLKLGGAGLWWGLAVGFALASLLLIWRLSIFIAEREKLKLVSTN